MEQSTAFSARSGAVAILVLALLIAALVRPGSVASPDSVFYIDGARQLARGEGFSISMIPLERGDEPATRLPVSVFPPGFSALLAALPVAGCSPSVARASVELTAYLAYLMLSYLLLLRMVGRETACVFAAVFAIHPSLDRWLQRGATACIALFEQPPSAGAAQAAPAHGAMLESLRAAGRIERIAKGPGGEVWREIQR